MLAAAMTAPAGDFYPDDFANLTVPRGNLAATILFARFLKWWRSSRLRRGGQVWVALSRDE